MAGLLDDWNQWVAEYVDGLDGSMDGRADGWMDGGWDGGFGFDSKDAGLKNKNDSRNMMIS